MDVQQLRAVDHQRAAVIAVAVATNDDAMVAQAIVDAYEDPHDAAIEGVMIALGLNLSQMLSATIGPDAAVQLLRATLAQLVEAEESGS